MRLLAPFHVVLAFPLLAPAHAAQLASPGQPASTRHPELLAATPPVYLLPPPDVARLMEEDEARQQWPFRYGAVIPTAFSSDEFGEWSALPDGELVWRLALRSPGALSLGLLLDRFELPPGGELYLYDPARTSVLGAFTAAARQENGMLAVQPLLGDQLVLEYVQPASVLQRPTLRVAEVVHDYRGILDRLLLETPVGIERGGCLVDINCPAGDEYQDIKRSVMMVLMGGGLCSAGLLNNTAEDGTPYFLTANHCGNMTNVVAVFGYENAGCGPGGASQAQTISGATLLAASTRYDSQLYRLSSTPPAAYEPFFAGWERGSAPIGPGLSISHPSGFPKKLARDDSAPVLSGTDFRVIWELGRLEGGSSGSPLFSGAKRVLGPACCVSDFYCNSQWAIYGRFGGFYGQMDLEQWLDPLTLDPQAFDGHDPFNGEATLYNGSGANPVLYASLTPPSLGTNWQATVDTNAIPGAGATWILGHAAPDAGVFLPQGELLVDLASPRYFLSIAPSVAGLASHSNPIPNQPALAGLTAHTQALVFAPGPVLLTNGITLLLR
jgi:hypothetical protein